MNLKQEIMIKKIDINKVIISGIVLSVIIFSIVKSNFQGEKIDEINKRGIEIVTKFAYFKKYPKSKSYFFEFYYLNNKLTEEIGRAPKGFIYNTGKYYRAKYLPKYPDLLIIKFDEEVTDEQEIKKAGF